MTFRTFGLFMGLLIALLLTSGSAYRFEIHFKYRKPYHFSIHNLLETGIIVKWQRDYLANPTSCRLNDITGAKKVI